MHPGLAENSSLVPRSPNPDLPPELEYTTLEWLHEDGPSIASCSLVCRRWQPIAQSLLFSTTRVLTYKYIPGSRDRFDIQRIPKFFQFLLASPTIASYIRDLRLDGHFRPIDISFELLRALLSRLPRLHFLKLDRIQFAISSASPVSDVDRTSLGYNRTLSKLAVDYCASPNRDLSDVLSFICMFSEIGRLRISGDNWTALSSIDRYLSHVPTVRSVRLDNLHESCMSAMCSMIRASGSLGGHLTSLTFGNGIDESIDIAKSFAGLAREAGPHLRTLKLLLLYSDGGISYMHDVCRALDLSTCSALRTLKLYFLASGEELASYHETERLWLATCVDASAELLAAHKRTLPALQTVRISLDTDGAGNLVFDTLLHAAQDGRAIWRPLEAALMDIGTLSRVEVVVRDDCHRLTHDGRDLIRMLVELGLAALLESHARNPNFFHLNFAAKRGS